MERIKQSVAILKSDESVFGTAFLISNDLLLTSQHNFEDEEYSNFRIFFPQNDEKEYKISQIYFEKAKDLGIEPNDIAIIKVNEYIDGIQPLELDFSEISIEDEWQAYGFPIMKGDIGERFKGKINDLLPRGKKKFDINLSCEFPNIIEYDYNITGASGSPIIRNGKVVAVLSNSSTGGTIGASSIQSSKELFEQHIGSLNDRNIIRITEPNIERAIENAERFIEGFPEELHLMMQDALTELINEITTDFEVFKEFLEISKYPIANERNKYEGIEETLEILLLIRCIYNNVQILSKDDFSNLSIKTPKIINFSFIYAQKRNQIMPEILLELHTNLVKKSASQILIDNQLPIPPYPIIFDNCSKSKKHNLCESCGKEFEFKGILKKFISTEDDDFLKGIEDNNFASLNKTKVVCAECVRDVRDDVSTKDDLIRMVMKKIDR